MLSEIEHLQSILADIIKQTISPSTLPLAGEDLVRDFRLSDHPDDQVIRRPYNNLKNYFVVCRLSLFTLRPPSTKQEIIQGTEKLLNGGKERQVFMPQPC